MYKVAVIGDMDSVKAFSMLGITAVSLAEDEKLEHVVHTLIEKEYAVIFITEDIVKTDQWILKEYKNSLVPAIIPIPNNQGCQGYGVDRMKDLVERAIGMDLFYQDKN